MTLQSTDREREERTRASESGSRRAMGEPAGDECDGTIRGIQPDWLACEVKTEGEPGKCDGTIRGMRPDWMMVSVKAEGEPGNEHCRLTLPPPTPPTPPPPPPPPLTPPPRPPPRFAAAASPAVGRDGTIRGIQPYWLAREVKTEGDGRNGIIPEMRPDWLVWEDERAVPAESANTNNVHNGLPEPSNAPPICEHNRVKGVCKVPPTTPGLPSVLCARMRVLTCVGIARWGQECRGSQICEHNRHKSVCKVILPHRGCRWCSARACVC